MAYKDKKRNAGTVLSGGLGSRFLMIMLAVLALVCLPLTMLGTLPSNLLGLSVDEAAESRERVREALDEPYEQAMHSRQFQKKAREVFEAEPFSCRGEGTFAYRQEGGNTVMTYDTRETDAAGNQEGCLISFRFSPGLEPMADMISAYITAVDGTLALYSMYLPEGDSMPETEYPAPEAPVLDEEDSTVTESGKELLEDTPYTDASGSAFLDLVRGSAGSFFFADRKPQRWLGMPDYSDEEGWDMETLEYEHTEEGWPEDTSGTVRREIHRYHIMTDEEACYVPFDPGSAELIRIDCDEYRPDMVRVNEIQERDYTADVVLGSVDVSIYYSLYGYELPKINRTIASMAGRGRCSTDESASDSCTVDEAGTAVRETIHEYYMNYMAGFNSGCERLDGGLKEELLQSYDSCFALADRQDEVFARIISDEGRQAIRDWGYTVIVSPGLNHSEPFVLYLDGEGTFSGTADGLSPVSWAETEALRSAGIVNAEKRNCTAYAQAWFWNHYHLSPMRGNGGEMALNLVLLYPEKFTLYQDIVPGAVVSVLDSDYMSAAGRIYGHVLCIDAVDWEAGTVTVSHGNTRFPGNVDGIEANSTVSISDFKARFGTYIVAGPK